jgi:hypothetical protein
MALKSRSESGAAPAAGRCSQFERRHPDARVTHHQDRPVLRLLVLHDDAQREFDYANGAEQALERADSGGWTVISIKNDWGTVF